MITYRHYLANLGSCRGSTHLFKIRMYWPSVQWPDYAQSEATSYSSKHHQYSDLTKLLAVTAYVLWFANNAKCTSTSPNTNTPLSPAELAKATVKWIHATQHQNFSAEIQNLQSQSPRLLLVQQLRLFLDKNTLLKCSGWIHNAPLSEQVKFPHLLPSKHHFTNLVILQAHTQLHHSDVNATLTLIRQHYWILSVSKECDHFSVSVSSARELQVKPPTISQGSCECLMPLWGYWGGLYRALFVCSSTGEQKVYICLFTCAVSRAIILCVI